MLNITVENIGELAIVECEGRIVHSESAHKLREAVTSQSGARIVLVFLQRWAREHDIRFLLFDPSKSVRSRLEGAKSIAKFYIPSFQEMMALLVYANSPYALAACR
jgi:hypothetical protein